MKALFTRPPLDRVGLQHVIGSPLVQHRLIGLDDVLVGKSALLDGQLAALFAVIHNIGQLMVRVVQAGLIQLAGFGFGVVNLWTLNLLKRLHGADGAD